MKRFLLTIALGLTLPFVANATVTVNDQQHVLSGPQLAALQNASSNHRVVANFVDASSKAELEGMMSRCITTPNTICVGVDTKHKFTMSRFGVDTGIRASDFQQVSLAGNLDFKEGRWSDGVLSIISRANVVSQRTSTGATPVIINQPVVEKPFPMWPFYIGFGFLILAGWLVIRRIRKNERKAMDAIDDVRKEAGELASRNIEAEKQSEFDRELEAVKARTSPTFHSTVTGRTDSTKPNYSNRPKADPYQPRVRKTATPRPVVHVVRDTPPPPPVVVVSPPSSGLGDFATGMMIGEALSHRHHTPTPLPVHHR